MTALNDTSNLYKKLKNGEFVITAELSPPKVPDLSRPKTSGVGSGGGLGTRPGGALGTPAPKPQP